MTLRKAICLYENMIRINIEDDNELFDTFEEENRIVLIESILSNLEVVQDRCKTNGRTQDLSIIKFLE